MTESVNIYFLMNIESNSFPEYLVTYLLIRHNWWQSQNNLSESSKSKIQRNASLNYL